MFRGFGAGASLTHGRARPRRARWRRSRAALSGCSTHNRLVIRTPQVTLYSRDLPRAVSFYEALGFREAFRYPSEGAPEHVELLLDGFSLGVATVETAVANHGLDPVPGGRGMELV